MAEWKRDGVSYEDQIAMVDEFVRIPMDGGDRLLFIEFLGMREHLRTLASFQKDQQAMTDGSKYDEW
jgi:hypothetical protein